MLAWIALACGPSPAPVSAPPTAMERRPHEITVDCAGPADYAALVDAVGAAHDGDLITVSPCTYYGTVDLAGKSLRVASTGGAATTTIAASPGRAALVAHHGEGARTVVSGFTLIGGGGPADPGGVDLEMASLRLEHSVVTGTSGTHAIHGRSADLVLADVRVEGNTVSETSVIDAQRGYLLLVDSTVACGAAGQGVQIDHGAFLVDRTTLACGGADAVYNQHSVGRIQRSSVDGRIWWEAESSGDDMVVETTVLGGGMLVQDGTLELRNAIVVRAPIQLDSAGSGTVIEDTAFRQTGPCAIDGAESSMLFRNDAFFATARFCGTDRSDSGNLDVDCGHVDPAGGDWHLAPGSPCVDAGAASSDPDVDGSRNDIGIYGGPMSQDGGW